MSWVALPHPDAVTGALGGIVQLVARPVANSLADLAAYRGVSMRDFFPAPGGVPEVRVARRWRLPGLVSEDLVFRSQHEPIEARFRRRYLTEYRANHTVYARRIRPRGATRRPQLLYLHGYMQPETPIEELALLGSMALALDAEIVQMQPAYHGRRRPAMSRFSGEFYWTADLVRSFEALRQTVLDARTLVGWMLKQGARPVGVAGLSLGGLLSAVLTCVEARLAFSVPLVAHMDLRALVADAPVLGRMRRDLRAFGWDIDDLGSFLESLGWYTLRPLLDPQRILLVAATQDRFFDPAVVEAMWREWGRPPIRWYPANHMGFVARLPRVIREMRIFLDRQAAHTSFGNTRSVKSTKLSWESGAHIR